MALCNIVGDLCYLGFAFAAKGWVSPPKLSGAAFAMLAHMVLLAYGDDQARHIACESGVISRIILRMRAFAQRALRSMPEKAQSLARAKPVGVPFAMLCMNGVGLLTDAVFARGSSLASTSQMMLGLCIVAGCGSYALADFVREQKTANMFLKLAPTLLVGAYLSNAGLALATHNGFLILALAVFFLSNVTGFYTKIDKDPVVIAEN